MRGCRARFTSRQVYWFDSWAGRLAILHSLLSAYLMSNLLRFDYGGFAISMGFTVTVAVFGVLVMLFVAKARVSKSERYARYGFRLAAAYVLFSVGVMAVSGTYVLGMAVVSGHWGNLKLANSFAAS